MWFFSKSGIELGVILFQNSNLQRWTIRFCWVKEINFTLRKRSSANEEKKNDPLFINNNLLKIHKKHFCECCKEYVYRQGLYLHRKTCYFIKENNQKCNDNQIVEDTTQKLEQKDELISYLIKENQEFKGLILEVCKNSANFSTLVW